jgi:hypothetical protein
LDDAAPSISAPPTQLISAFPPQIFFFFLLAEKNPCSRKNDANAKWTEPNTKARALTRRVYNLIASERDRSDGLSRMSTKVLNS